MEKEEHSTKYESLGVPQKLIIQNGTYVFKKALHNSLLSYRYIHRRCKASVKISVENAKTININEINNKAVYFTFLGIHENHPESSKEDTSIKEIKIERENYDLAKKLISNNLTLPLSFHIHNLDANKILLPKTKIKNILQQLKEEKSPKDDQFLEHIEFITIDLGEIEEMKNLFFCLGKENFINPKSKKLEKKIYFSSIFQLKLFDECNEIFIDGTFKMAPKNYYQILNFWGYLDLKNIYVPLMHILMTSKNIIAYNHVFNFILQIFNDNNIKVNFKSKDITTDYERAIRLSINLILKPKTLKGCFFILVKLYGKNAAIMA